MFSPKKNPWHEDPLRKLFQPDGYDGHKEGHRPGYAVFYVRESGLVRVPYKIHNFTGAVWADPGTRSIQTLDVWYNKDGRKPLHLGSVHGHIRKLDEQGRLDCSHVHGAMNLIIETYIGKDPAAAERKLAAEKDQRSFLPTPAQIIVIAKVLKIPGAETFPDNFEG